jgi:hypothetical protein
MNYNNETEEHKIEPHNLRDHECVLVHCERGFRRTGKWSRSGETVGTQPEQNNRRRAAGGSTPNIRCRADAARDERTFCGAEPAWS